LKRNLTLSLSHGISPEAAEEFAKKSEMANPPTK